MAIFKIIMMSIMFKKEKLLSLAIWSFFSFSVIKVLSVFFYMVKGNFLHLLIITVSYASLFFIYYFIFRTRYGARLNFAQYTVSNILYAAMLTLFSYGYYVLIMLKNDFFNAGFYIVLAISNLLIGSLLFLFTLIKKQ
jgi:hypothetical protein